MKKTIIALFILVMSGASANASSFKNLNRNIHTDDIFTGGINNDLTTQKKYKEDKLLTEAKDLEAVLISTMVDPMFPKGNESSLYGGGHGSDIYRMMMIEEYGKILSNAGGIGVAKGIAKQLTKK